MMKIIKKTQMPAELALQVFTSGTVLQALWPPIIY